jgi:hypothetical protein
MNTRVETTPEQLAALAARPDDTPILVVTLLKFRQLDGFQRYVWYAREVAQHLMRVGARMRSVGTAPSFIIGNGAALVGCHHRRRIPSPTAFLEVVSSHDYAAITEHRMAALDRVELIATTVWPIETQRLTFRSR